MYPIKPPCGERRRIGRVIFKMTGRMELELGTLSISSGLSDFDLFP
jgi:hypothetical protein